jgi:uncharacterized phage-like protein YoqJ
MGKTCCFSGHRSDKFDLDYSYLGHIMQSLLAKAILAAINDGFVHFYTGMARGFDIIAAENLIKQRYILENAEVQLHCIIPYQGQERKWPATWQKRHDAVLKASDSIVILNEKFATGVYYERNAYMVKHSQMLLCYFNGKDGGTAHTFKLAQENNIEIINIWENLQLIKGDI